MQQGWRRFRFLFRNVPRPVAAGLRPGLPFIHEMSIPCDLRKGDRAMKFAKITYWLAAIYGVLVLLPGFFLEERFSQTIPPALTHPEFYYGFYGSALVWQFAFFLIARDPVRYRSLMLIAVLEKAAFLIACLALWSSGRMEPSGPLYGSLMDGVWMILFAFAWLRTPQQP